MSSGERGCICFGGDTCSFGGLFLGDGLSRFPLSFPKVAAVRCVVALVGDMYELVFFWRRGLCWACATLEVAFIVDASLFTGDPGAGTGILVGETR